MSARVKSKSRPSRQDAAKWRRFLTNSPPLHDLIEMRRLQDNKMSLRRRGELPPVAAIRPGEWRL